MLGKYCETTRTKHFEIQNPAETTLDVYRHGQPMS